MRMILSNEQFNLLKTGTFVSINGKTRYFHLPFWFQELEDGTFECFTFDRLPAELIEYLKLQRETKTENNDNTTE